MKNWILSLVQTASKEQLHGIPRSRRICTRHDNVVYWILKIITIHLMTPEGISNDIRSGRAYFNAEFNFRVRHVMIKTGHKILTENKLYHKKPDIMIRFTNSAEIIID